MFSDLLERTKALLFRGRQERELDEELRDHLARDIEARRRSGSGDAGREAALAFGGIERVKEDVRDARGTRPLEEILADVRYAARALRRNVGFTVTVVAVLGVAIGAATAVFAAIKCVVVSELPYPDAQQLVRVYQKNSPTNMWSLSVVDVQAIAAQQRVFQAFGAAQAGVASVSGAGAPQRVAIGRVTSGFFDALALRPLAGRMFSMVDERPESEPTVVVSSRFAENTLGGSGSAIGRRLLIDGVSHVVVGVLPQGRGELAGITAELWPVLRMPVPSRRGPFGYRGIGRLKPGVSLAQATAELGALSERMFPIWAAGFQDKTARLTPVPLRDAVVGGATRQMALFGGAVALTLLLAIANVATLVVVRTAGRDHELSVRVALGAGRRRVVRLLLTECLLLTLLAGAAGVALAALAIKSVGVVAPSLPRLAEVRLDLDALLFALGIAVLSGMLLSIAPLASSLVRGGVKQGSLAISPARTGPGRRSTLVRAMLVSAEFALVVPLLTGAGLLLNSFLRLQQVSPGFNPEGVASLLISLPARRYSDSSESARFWRLSESGALAIPGVSAVGLATYLPPDNGGDVNNFDLVDRPVPPGTSQPVVPWSTVSPGYFTALGIPLIEGRTFGAQDSLGAPPVVLVSRSWSTKYYPNASAVGRELISGGCTSCPRTTIVGVVGDVPYLGLASPGEGMYAPLAQGSPRTLNLVVRTHDAAGVTLGRLRALVHSLDPDIAPAEVVLTEHLDRSLGDPRRWTAVVSSFAGAGVLLSALGVFGLMSFVVRQRRRELGVRLALGAPPASLTGLVMRRGMTYACIGVLIGLGLAAFESRWLGTLLFQVEATDPLTMVVAVSALLAVAAVACWLPGRQAARIKPLEVTSGE